MGCSISPQALLLSMVGFYYLKRKTVQKDGELANLRTNLPTNLQTSVPTNLPMSLPTNLPLSLPPNLPASMPEVTACDLSNTKFIEPVGKVHMSALINEDGESDDEGPERKLVRTKGKKLRSAGCGDETTSKVLVGKIGGINSGANLLKEFAAVEKVNSDERLSANLSKELGAVGKVNSAELLPAANLAPNAAPKGRKRSGKKHKKNADASLVNSD